MNEATNKCATQEENYIAVVGGRCLRGHVVDTQNSRGVMYTTYRPMTLKMFYGTACKLGGRALCNG